nr:basic proline-rich protein-like isoform X2 [Macaca fascicularis]XP_045233451.1 basic proline-rich protein-like isoform X2 [Macaca fascicularis]XP_045233452.1 basic proline-rich protein-like isoform X2 [Macaca fascicularis]XP_045233453.1 basic proline-rich protein-like isoform X2 [Macaca fascicularis]XP_045233454.1 basic proline-rich protein-like isoform X2 [Macaca fascicularis]XP_045233455.1 basic proline-rich protein-like isoform X2 [Macaca fascicularis]
MAPPAAPAPPLSAPAPGSARPWAPGSECGRAPCSGHGLGAPGGAGGGRGPSALMPGPAGECWVRGPARRRLLRGRRGCCSGPRASSGAFSLPVGPPAGLGSTEALRPQRSLRSPPPESPPPRPAALWSLRAPLAPAPAPGAHVTGASEHAPRGRSPRPPRAHTLAPARQPCPLTPRPGPLRPWGQRAEPVLLQPALSSGSWWCPSVDLHPQEHLLQTSDFKSEMTAKNSTASKFLPSHPSKRDFTVMDQLSHVPTPGQSITRVAESLR